MRRAAAGEQVGRQDAGERDDLADRDATEARKAAVPVVSSTARAAAANAVSHGATSRCSRPRAIRSG